MAPFERQTISPESAQDLVDQGGWAYESVLREHAVKIFVERQSTLPPAHPDWKKIEEVLAQSHKLLEEFPAQLIRDDWRPATMGMRIGPGAVLQIGDGLRAAIPHAIAFAMHIAASAQINSIFYGTALLHLYHIMDSLKKMWVRITDPDEKIVFEAVAELSSTRVIVDYSALERKDILEAYGRQAPLAAQIIAHVDTTIDARTVEKALASLERQGILRESQGRWRIAL